MMIKFRQLKSEILRLRDEVHYSINRVHWQRQHNDIVMDWWSLDTDLGFDDFGKITLAKCLNGELDIRIQERDAVRWRCPYDVLVSVLSKKMCSYLVKIAGGN